MNHKKKINIETRPWGFFEIIKETDSFKIKKICVKPGHRLSYQFHKKRSETWIMISGKGILIIDDIEYNYSPGKTFTIPVKAKHRIENNSDDETIFIEIQTGSYFGEDDIIRLDDDYKRI